jgi:preprotein translocase SecE subunit
MATAVEPGSEPRTPTSPASLALVALLGAVYVVAVFAVVLYAFPAFWAENVAPTLAGNRLVSTPLRVVAQLGVLGVLVWFGRQLLGANPPRGVHGGIFLMISAAVTIFFLWRAVALNLDSQVGQIVAGVFAAFLVFLALRFFTGPGGERRMVGLEEQGWFSTASYKKSLGVRVRRLTMLGVLLVGGTGVYSLSMAGTLPEEWTLALPFESPNNVFRVLPDAKMLIPGILLALTVWVAWRAVNVPTFAEFLIATEAEMNKVSWTPKKRLGQDTVVVLTTTLILTLFLLVVDLFWGWLLSNVGVLPERKPADAKEAQQARW